MGGKPGQSGQLVGFRAQPAAGQPYTDAVYSTTDNRLNCPYCSGQWFMVKDTKCMDDGQLPTTMDGYGAAGTKDMIIFLCHCGREFAKDVDLVAGNWTAQ